jgi:hypothetical protein
MADGNSYSFFPNDVSIFRHVINRGIWAFPFFRTGIIIQEQGFDETSSLRNAEFRFRRVT